jgi:type I restriction enzyme S subunit
VNLWPETCRGTLRPLKRVCVLNPEMLPESTDPDFEFEYIDIGNVTLEGGISAREQMKFESAPSRARKPVRAGDVIVSTVRTYLKAVASIGQDADRWVVSTGFAVLRSGPEVDPRFLYRLVQSNPFVESVVAESTGVSYPAINPSALGSIPVPCPDLSTQKAIADFLDREIPRIDQLIDKKQRLTERLFELEKTLLYSLLSQIEARRWRTRHVGKLKNGAGFPVELQGDPTQDIAFFKVKHLKTFGLDAAITQTEDTVSLETAKQLKATIFPAGTIVFAKIGAALLLGRFSMIGRRACLDNNMAAFVPNIGLIDPHFCLLALSQIDMATMVQPGAVPSLSSEIFGNYELPLPPLEAQRQLVVKFRSRRGPLSAALEATKTSIGRLRVFRAALITAAVTGQIDVATWRRQGATGQRLDEIQEAMLA